MKCGRTFFYLEKSSCFPSLVFVILRNKEGILILIAKTKEGTLIRLTQDLKREWLRKWRRTTTFYCPQCDDVLQLKVGDIVMPHFAHKKDATCSASFSEGETTEHLQGKQQLYHFLTGISDDVKLEPYFNILAQRPDLLVTVDGQTIPIEFQCSTIPISLVEERTNSYEKAGMNPIWVIHTPQKLKTLPQGVQKMKFSRYEACFFTNNIPEGLVLLTYDPKFERFHYYSTLQHIVGRQYIGMHRILPISKQIFPFARPKNPTLLDLQHYYSLFREMREAFLRSAIFVNRKGINNPFLRKCYALRIIPSELPIWIGVPIPFQNPFSEHPCEWQLAFIHYAKQQNYHLNNLSFFEIKRFVQQYDGDFEQQVAACVKYQKFLIDLGNECLDLTVDFEERSFMESLLSHSLQNEVKIEKM